VDVLVAVVGEDTSAIRDAMAAESAAGVDAIEG
jgi:hypothetical protein